MKIKIKMKIRGKCRVRGLLNLNWSPYTAPDLCGYPSGFGGLGAGAPAQFAPSTGADRRSADVLGGMR